ncbi:MAG: alkaline phosphatase family protein, partial [Gemmatimonadaceae bacterium]
CTRPPYARSYLGAQMRHLDEDLAPAVPTLFELAPSRFNAMSMLGRGTRKRERIGRDARTLLRVARTHWMGNVAGWIALDRAVARESTRRVIAQQPAFSCIALLGLDKASHAFGHESDRARDALAAIDASVGELRDGLERAGRWDETTLWIVSDHGHSRVSGHDDLVHVVHAAGYSVLSHPWLLTRRAMVAVMVGGNAMAHLYVELDRRTRAGWPALRDRWEPLASALLERESVDLVILPHDDAHTEVRGRGRGRAMIEHAHGRFSYRPITGDPLGVGRELHALSSRDAYDALADGDYPDAIVQIAQIAASARSGDIILSAAPSWDFREKWEPVPHVSTHGSLRREHMMVPLLTSRPLCGRARRTTDIAASALDVLGLPAVGDLDGESFA